MRRDLEQWRADGERLLSRHKSFDLTIREIGELIEDLGINDKMDFHSGLSNGFYLGVEVGKRIATIESKRGARA